jgi:hypothetical protein
LHAFPDTKLVLPKGILEDGLPHLLRLSVAYLDASCEDLSDVTWEQLARKLGLKVEVSEGAWGPQCQMRGQWCGRRGTVSQLLMQLEVGPCDRQCKPTTLVPCDAALHAV